MSLATSREKRNNAGNRMQRMLEEEQEDDFYKTTYGGFNEESGDEEFSSGEEGKTGEETSSDSDISASEDDEVISEDEDDEPKRAKRVITKAYKEPVKQKEIKKDGTPHQVTKQPTKTRQRSATRGTDSQVRKSSRRSTVQRVNEFQRRIKEREEKSRNIRASMAKKVPPGMRRLTQEELLREARITEKQNLASLKVYQQMEAEKKKVKITKRVHHGPKIRFHSLTMPLIEELPSPTTDIVNVDTTGVIEETPVAKKCSRNFITISEDKLYSQFFPKKSGRPPARLYCPVTRMPAKYIDPVTSIPYATKKAFKIIRETYATEIENAMMDRRKREKKYAKT